MHNIDLEKNSNIISNKKQSFEVQKPLHKYLKAYARNKQLPCLYNDLMRYSFSMPYIDNAGNDTLWETVFYSEIDMQEIYPALARIYAILKTDGDMTVMEHLYVDRVDYCTFGNSNPFRVKIVNNYNDNYDYYYVKIADASRIYGLELEHILSPNRINYLVYKNTLIEEHIAGIPGDVFTQKHLRDSGINETRIAKEFLKFNERCFVKLLGDMRAYNFVIDVTPDFDDVQYRIRAIDFDQQCYEGKMNLYLPQFFRENSPYVQLCMKTMTPETVRQYQREERTLIGNRVKASRYRLKDLMDVMVTDQLSTKENVLSLRRELAKHYQTKEFDDCNTMGDIVKKSLYIAFTEKQLTSLKRKQAS